jgi:hypothetical protein
MTMAKKRATMTCDEATRLMSEAQDRSLQMGERTVLRMHTWVCTGCRQFRQQLGFIHQAMTGFAQRSQSDTDDQPPGAN